MLKVTGGRTLYGHAVGIIMLDTVFPRVVGDVGNARTWPFPVRYCVVKGAVSARITGVSPDEALLQEVVVAAQALQKEGVKAITTSCGYFAIFQREIASAVSVPVLTSALLQVPLAARLIGVKRRVGILTERPNLTPRHFAGAGWSEQEIPISVGTLPPEATFPKVFIEGALDADVDLLEEEVVDAAEALVRQHPDVGAIVCECTNFVPFSKGIRFRTGLPVFDLYTLVMGAYEAIVGTTFEGGI